MQRQLVRRTVDADIQVVVIARHTDVGRHDPHTKLHDVDIARCGVGFIDGVLAGTDPEEIGVIADAAGQRIIASPPVQSVVAFPAVQSVVVRSAVQAVVSGISVQGVRPSTSN